MAWRISCPRCQHEVLTREAGAFVLLCPQCGLASDVEPASAAAAPGSQHGGQPAPRPAPPNPWYAFGAGARLLTIGYLIELATLVLLGLTLIVYASMNTADRSSYRGPGYQSALEAITVLIPLGFLSGSVIVVRGRTLQASVPRGERLRGPLFGAAVFAWLQCLTTFSAVALVWDRTVGAGWVSRDYSNLWPVLLVAAVLLRWFAEMSSLAAFGSVSAAMPSRRLASGVSRATTENQPLWAVGTVFVVVLGLTQTRLFWGISATIRVNGAVVMMATGFALLLVSTLVNWSLYSSARRAVAAWKPPQTAPGA